MMLIIMVDKLKSNIVCVKWQRSKSDVQNDLVLKVKVKVNFTINLVPYLGRTTVLIIIIIIYLVKRKIYMNVLYSADTMLVDDR